MCLQPRKPAARSGSVLSYHLFVSVFTTRFEIKKKLKTAKKKEKKEKKKKQEEEQEKKKLTQIQESQVGNEAVLSKKPFFPWQLETRCCLFLPLMFSLNVKQCDKQVRI